MRKRLPQLGNLNYSGDHFDTYAYPEPQLAAHADDQREFGREIQLRVDPQYSATGGLHSLASVPGLINFNQPNTQKTAFAPLVGFAWSPGFVKNTVFRAGFSMNYDTTYSAQNLPTVPPGTVTTAFVPTYGFFPGFFGLGGLGYPYPVNIFNPSITPAQARAQTTSYIPDQVLPYSMNWNASLQQQVFHRLIVERAT